MDEQTNFVTFFGDENQPKLFIIFKQNFKENQSKKA